jgi:hypothetical protein
MFGQDLMFTVSRSKDANLQEKIANFYHAHDWGNVFQRIFT